MSKKKVVQKKSSQSKRPTNKYFNWLKTKGLMYVKYFIIGFFGLSIITTILFRFVPIPITPLMLIRCTEQVMDKNKDLKLYKDWVSIEHISGPMKLAVVCSEDQKYLDHFGFDLESIKKVLDNRGSKKRIRGASTISQQTAKNVFLWPGRSWIRKGLEVYFTLLIETFWSKERILEVYLNIAEMGEGIYGVEAAGQTYFKKEAKTINKSEAALIAAILPNPRKYSAVNPSSYIRARQRWIKRQMSYWGNDLDFSKEEEEETQQSKKTKRK